MSNVIIIAAVSENGFIGRDGKIPWRIPEDMLRFKGLTLGQIVVMGRKTYESLPPKWRPLPDRLNVVLTRGYTQNHPALNVGGTGQYPGCRVSTRLWDVLYEFEDTHDKRDVYIIGGAEIYKLALPYANKILLTRVHKVVEGDARFPEFNRHHWRLQHSENRAQEQPEPLEFTYEEYIHA